MIWIYWRLKIFYDPDFLSSYDVPTFLIKLLLLSSSRKPSREVGMLAKYTREYECSWKRFWLSTCYHEILMNDTMIQEIWWHHWRFWEKKELRVVVTKNQCNQYFNLAFQQEQREKKSRRQKSLMSMTNHGCGYWDLYSKHDNSELSHSRRCICKIPWPSGISKLDREFPSRSLRKSEESRARIAVDQEIEATSSLKDLINPNQLREKISLIMKNWIWWWRQNWNGATMLFIWSSKLPSVEPWQDKKGEKLLHRAEGWRMFFSGRQLGLVQEETLVVFYTRMPRETVRTTWDEVEIRKKFSPRASILFSTESEETDWREKLEQSLRPVLRLKQKNPSSMVGKMKKIVMWFSTSSRMSWLQVWKQMHSWLSLPHFDMLTVKGNPARVRKRIRKVLKAIWSCIFWKKNKSKGLCPFQDWGRSKADSIPGKVEELGLQRFGGTHQKILRMHLVQNWIRERERIWRHYPKRWTSWANPCAPSFEKKHLRKPHDKQIVPAK